uniref:Uncharacterized protein n=1 Tax=Plectus sambesii TaxID=2011161 RepID=A0A914XAM5_9BILA
MPTVSDQTHLEQAHKLKEEANKYYTAQDYGKAIRLYHECLLHARAIQQLSQSGLTGLARVERLQHDSSGAVEEDDVAIGEQPEDAQTSGGPERTRINSTSRGEEMKEEANAIILKSYNNLAACILQGANRGPKDFLRAVEYCDKVLAMDKTNEKALFRKGVCLARAGQHEKAVAVLKLCSNNKEAQAQIARCEQEIAEDRRKRDEEIRRNFARAQARENARLLQQQNADQNGNAVGDGVVLNGDISMKDAA